MTNAIDTTAFRAGTQFMQNLQSDLQLESLKAPAMDPEIRSRLLQLGNVIRSASRAATTQLMLTGQLMEEGVGTAGPPHTDVLSDPGALEELNRKKQKERVLVSSLRKALDDSARTQADLLAAFSFLLPQITPGMLPEDEPDIGLPGFQSPMKNPADMDMSGLIWNSHADFFAQISALLEVLKTEWLSKYQDSLAKFLEFYQEFSDIMEQIKPEASGDKGDVVIDFNKIAHALKDLMQKYGQDANALASFPTRAAAEAFVKSMGIPLTITESADGTFHVKMDMKAVSDLVGQMPHLPNNPSFSYPVKWDSAKYNAWVNAKDSNMEQIKHVSKVLGEKLNEMTQKFDNIVKILSSSIEKMSEANNAYVHNT